MMKKIQRFGGAMLAPVMLFSFFGIVIGFSLLLSNQTIMGDIAAPDTLWYKFWNVVAAGGWTPFFQLPLLFVVGLPISLAKKYAARATMEALVIYIAFNYFVNAILTLWPCGSISRNSRWFWVNIDCWNHYFRYGHDRSIVDFRCRGLFA